MVCRVSHALMAQVTVSQCITPIFSGHVYKSAQTVGRKGGGGGRGGGERGQGMACPPPTSVALTFSNSRR